MDRIIINELEVFYCVGVPDEERARPQRLLVTVEMTRDLAVAAKTDDLAETIDYYAVTQRLLRFGDGRSWRLIEKLAADIAEMILREFGAESVSVEIRKFVIAQANFVATRVTRMATK